MFPPVSPTDVLCGIKADDSDQVFHSHSAIMNIGVNKKSGGEVLPREADPEDNSQARRALTISAYFNTTVMDIKGICTYVNGKSQVQGNTTKFRVHGEPSSVHSARRPAPSVSNGLQSQTFYNISSSNSFSPLSDDAMPELQSDVESEDAFDIRSEWSDPDDSDQDFYDDVVPHA